MMMTAGSGKRGDDDQKEDDLKQPQQQEQTDSRKSRKNHQQQSSSSSFSCTKTTGTMIRLTCSLLLLISVIAHQYECVSGQQESSSSRSAKGTIDPRVITYPGTSCEEDFSHIPPALFSSFSLISSGQKGEEEDE
jgi:hypothetical protein